MKKIFVLTGVIIFLSLEVFSQKKFHDIIGNWKVAGEQASGASLQIIDSSDLIFTYQGERKKILDYDIDFSKSPVWFDFSINDTASVVKVKSIMEVINDNTIKWQIFIDEDRLDHFTTGKGELFYLIKEKTKTNPVSLTIKNNKVFFIFISCRQIKSLLSN